MRRGSMPVQRTLVGHTRGLHWPLRSRRDGFEPVAAVALGYAADPEVLPEGFREQEVGPRQRHPISEFVFAGAWGERW